MLLVLAWWLGWSVVLAYPLAGTGGLPGLAVERLPDSAATHQKGTGQRELVAGHEDAVHAAAGLLQARPRLRSGHDDDVAGGHADD